MKEISERKELERQAQIMAKKATRKLTPSIKAIADTINEHDQRLIDETREETTREIFDQLEKRFGIYKTETRWCESGEHGLKYYNTNLENADIIHINPNKYKALKSRYLKGGK